MLILVFVIGLLVVFVGGYQLAEKRMLSPKKAEAVEPAPEPHACEALVARVFEQRLVDAGIMTVPEMTTCTHHACADCAPSRKPPRQMRILGEKVREKCAVGNCEDAGINRWNEDEMLCSYHFHVRNVETKKFNSPKGLAGQSRYDKSARLGELKLRLEHNGVHNEFDWPKQIPTYAAVSVDNAGRDRHTVRVKFTWTDSSNGKQKAQVVLFPMLQWSAPRMTAERRDAAIRELTGRAPKRPSRGYS